MTSKQICVYFCTVSNYLVKGNAVIILSYVLENIKTILPPDMSHLSGFTVIGNTFLQVDQYTSKINKIFLISNPYLPSLYFLILSLKIDQ